MTVFIENLGGGGGIIPEMAPPFIDWYNLGNKQGALEPLWDFADNFKRPPYPVDATPITCDGIGTAWATQWIVAENGYPIFPTVTLDGQCQFESLQANHRAFTLCVPSWLAWNANTLTPSYVEMRMREKPDNAEWNAYICLNWSQNPGVIGYNPGCQSQPGFCYVSFGPASGNYTSTIFGTAFTYVMRDLTGITARLVDAGGGNQELVTIEVPDFGYNNPTVYPVWTNLPDAPLGTVKRLERNYDSTTGAWLWRVLFDGEIVYTSSLSQLWVGAPAMACRMGASTDNASNASPICRVDDFKAGWLRVPEGPFAGSSVPLSVPVPFSPRLRAHLPTLR